MRKSARFDNATLWKRFRVLSATAILMLSYAAFPTVRVFGGHSNDNEYAVEISGRGSYAADANGNPDPNGRKRTFSIDVVALPDGTAMGMASLKNRSSGLKADLLIDCVFLLDNLAVLSGVVIESSDPEIVSEGSAVFTALVDNGGGENDPPDRLAPMLIFDPDALGLPEVPPDLCLFIVENFGLPPAELLTPLEKGDFEIDYDD